MAVGDIDGDGDVDLVRGNYRQSVLLHLNQGGRFDSVAAWSGPVENTVSVALGDVDGDGDLDLVRGNYGGGATLYLNVAGRFKASPVWTGPIESTRSVTLGDIDGDGDLDLVRGIERPGNTLYLNAGTGTFTDATAPAWTGGRNQHPVGRTRRCRRRRRSRPGASATHGPAPHRLYLNDGTSALPAVTRRA